MKFAFSPLRFGRIRAFSRVLSKITFFTVTLEQNLRFSADFRRNLRFFRNPLTKFAFFVMLFFPMNIFAIYKFFRDPLSNFAYFTIALEQNVSFKERKLAL